MPGKTRQERDSRAMTKLLRHDAITRGLTVDGAGTALVRDVLALRGFGHMTSEDIREIVRNCAKQRFILHGDGDELRIGATQGHSFKVNSDELLTELTTEAAKELPMIVHGTYWKAWPIIREEGLSRMSRQHIHMATGLPGISVRSGMRTSSEILVYIDGAAAIDSGFKFYISANGVVLTGGDPSGHLPPRFFRRVVNARTGKELPFP